MPGESGGCRPQSVEELTEAALYQGRATDADLNQVKAADADLNPIGATDADLNQVKAAHADLDQVKAADAGPNRRERQMVTLTRGKQAETDCGGVAVEPAARNRIDAVFDRLRREAARD